jgi:hypothetical protein
MAFSDYKLERIVLVFLLCLALLMAFGPIAKLHDPAGARTSHAFDLGHEIAQMQSDVRAITSVTRSLKSGASSGTDSAASEALPMPFSLRAAAIFPCCVFAALIFSFLALVDLLFFRKAFALLSLVGGCFAAAALLHALLLDADLQSWTGLLASLSKASSPEDSTLVTRILVANSFQIAPGAGLYALVGCLLLVPLLWYTRAIQRFRSLRRSGTRVRISQTVRIRPLNSRYSEETCTSLDLSTTGLYLESASNHYYVGMEVYLSRLDPAKPGAPEEHGHVVRVEKTGEGGCRLAIHIIPA